MILRNLWSAEREHVYDSRQKVGCQKRPFFERKKRKLVTVEIPTEAINKKVIGLVRRLVVLLKLTNKIQTKIAPIVGVKGIR